MKLFATFVILTALGAGAAFAQDTPAPTVPPSTCPAIVQAPAAWTATASQQDMQAAVARYETWRAQAETTMQCRAAEVNALNAQTRARRAEYDAALADNQARAAAFQAQIEAAQARRNRR
ncbi:MAG: hypothetical protein IPG56_17420 [Caulobacteraceae bacterium]|nr:hypothetical protein [Caulobacteraceae bacterium]